MGEQTPLCAGSATPGDSAVVVPLLPAAVGGGVAGFQHL